MSRFEHYPVASCLSLIRAHQKDTAYISLLRDKIVELYQDLTLSPIIPSQINALSKFIYYVSCLSISVITPGEEYFRIFPFETRQFPSKLALLLRLLYESFLTGLLQNELKEWLHGKISHGMQKAWMRALESLHKSLFLINGKYPTLANRLSSLQYVALRRPLNVGESSTLIRYAGIASFLLSIVNLYWDCKEQKLLQADLQIPDNPVRNYPLNEDTVDSNIERQLIPFRCILCLDKCQDSVVTECGHVYCWQCIVGWIQEGKKSCPSCRDNLNPSRIYPIV